MANAAGKIQSTHRNEKSPTLNSLIGDAGGRSVEQIVAASRQNGAVSEYTFPVQQNGKAIGHVVLLLSRHAVIRQRAEIAEDFRHLTGQITTLKETLQADFQEQTRQAFRGSLGLGLWPDSAAILVGTVAACKLAGNIARPVRSCMESIVALANQDFSRHCRVVRSDDLGRGQRHQQVDRCHRESH